MLPLVLKYWGFAASDPEHPFEQRFSLIVEREWAAGKREKEKESGNRKTVKDKGERPEVSG